MNEKHDRKSSFVIMRKETYFIACCEDFLKAAVKEKRLEKIKSILNSNCFYSSGIDFVLEDDINACVNTNFDEGNFDYYCFFVKEMF